ncbi:DUF1641 domain-containing protein [Prolixibacter denitrificans]|uniref:Uncharacterized protein YjgD (DUF1641 family) n=1 Tax=Prolixibacter denitrificans TaxID=1541063 RepID=A0A2P8CKH2_9BACT|nr:DUF1641 domain-containing protein [Prolixibacter denitrificans]PSK85477.1 uncharacterized protein YjgD (DUF1641 family) [Prolixibacter denitrificans]GET20097.1 hypothetical protein JCM18694_03430 [Prolixibacter denitrificans]
MDDKALQVQISELNAKVDLLLEHVNEQRLKTNQLEDLVSDISIVGKDVYDTAVVELENRQVELDPEQLKGMGLRLLRNIGNFRDLLITFESMADLVKDVTPIVNETIMDFTDKLDEFDRKGYFEFLRESGNVLDKVITKVSVEDLKQLGENVEPMLEMLKALGRPEVIQGMKNATQALAETSNQKVPEVSVFRMMRELNKPEMKKALGFMVTFMKNFSTQ